MTIIVKPPQYDYCGLSISRYVIISIYFPSLLGLRPSENTGQLVCVWVGSDLKQYGIHWSNSSTNDLSIYQSTSVYLCIHSYVIQPYHNYPNLLDILFSFLKVEQMAGIRREVIRVLGLLGALDPYKHKQHQRSGHRSLMGTPISKPMDKSSKSQGPG